MYFMSDDVSLLQTVFLMHLHKRTYIHGREEKMHKKLYKCNITENKNVMRYYLATIVSSEENSSKMNENLPVSNPNLDLYNINTHTKFGENLLIFARYHPETKIRTCRGQITLKN